MRAPHLHFLGWNGPHSGLEVDLAPFGVPELAWPLKDMWSEPECQMRRRMALIVLNCPKKPAELDRINNGRAVLHLGGEKRVLQISARVRCQAGCRHTVAHHRANKLQGAPRALKLARGFDSLHRR